MATQYTGPTRQSYLDDQRHVGAMPATPSINRPAFSHFGPFSPHLTTSVCTTRTRSSIIGPGTKIMERINVVKCRITHSEVVKEFSLVFSESPIKSTVGAFKCPCGYYRMLQKFSFSPLSASSPPEMKQTQKIKTPIPYGSHVDCSSSLTKLTALQAPIAILSVCVYGRPGFYWWEKRYRCRHRHRFYRCVYARSYSNLSVAKV